MKQLVVLLEIYFVLALHSQIEIAAFAQHDENAACRIKPISCVSRDEKIVRIVL